MSLHMTEEERLRWNITAYRKSIDLDWAALAKKNVVSHQRKALMEHLAICVTSLKDANRRLERIAQSTSRDNTAA